LADYRHCAHRDLPSFPTRRSSDLGEDGLSVTGAQINANGRLIITLSDSSTIDAGVAKGDPGGGIDSRPRFSRSKIFRPPPRTGRSEEHTSELQSRENLVCRLLLEK